MEKSLYAQFAEKYLPAIVLGVVEKLNEQKTGLTYQHRLMLRKEFSLSGTWESLLGKNLRVAADVVAMDSPLPLKNRGAISKANGDIPKLGMQLFLNEKQMTEIDAMIASGRDINQIVAKIFADAPHVITGIYERLECMFLEGLSTGATVVDENNEGTGIRLDYGYLTENKFGVKVLWSTPATAKPLDDFQRVVDKAIADGNSVSKAYMDTKTINALLNCDQMKQQYAFASGFTGGNVPTPTLEQANVALNARFGFTIERVDRAIKTQKNGETKTTKPFKEGMVVFTDGGQVGSLVWSPLAESNHPVQGVSYATAEEFILTSKYRKNDPLREYTSSQARVVPVIDNVDKIYTIDSKQVQG
ncbi:hypothetical protein CAPN008_01350 [Capnocytophaga canis]|uniref:major capsid protein n=1 Tax=Capnocytophaga canis TaxID=1848903 RepID=UPI001AC8561E|nr:major capsid protein [Capnocytophaga canis]GIM60085.1 hypothetical protein CAPN008_01350 [Capnocytophaga canis]